MNDDPREMIETLLGGLPPVPNNGLRRGLLADTLGVVRGRRRRRYLHLVAALAVCYAAGAGSMYLGQRAGHRDLGIFAQGNSPPPLDAPATAATGDTHVASQASARHEQPSRPIAKAGRAGVRRMGYEEICRVTDRCLSEEGNVQAAIRYYTTALDSASPAQQAISIQDSWLLMALKEGRNKEK